MRQDCPGEHSGYHGRGMSSSTSKSVRDMHLFDGGAQRRSLQCRMLSAIGQPLMLLYLVELFHPCRQNMNTKTVQIRMEEFRCVQRNSGKFAPLTTRVNIDIEHCSMSMV